MLHMQRWLSALVLALALTLASCDQPAASIPPTASAATSAPTTAPPANPPTPVAAVPTPAVAGHLAWPTALPPGQELRPERSSLADGELALAFANPTNPQDELSILSQPDPGGDFGGACRETVTVRGVTGASCSTGAGVTVVWVEAGWRYYVGGGLLSTDKALALAESLELIDEATAAQRLQASGGQ
jgi:hypothetical protein